jgi:FOG: Transposase and inactivated derivatives
MKRVSSIFSQILQLVPRLEFEAAVREHQAERHARGFRCWSQFVAMRFCQLGHAQTLREITGGLAACEGKLRHLGVDLPPKRSTLAYANQHRPWQLFQTVFERFYQRCRAEAAHQGRRKFRFRHKLLSLDATMIPLCLSVFDWALYRRSKGAVKLHLVLDHDGWLPQFAVVTTGKTAEIEVARRQRFEPGTMLVFDRGYTDVAWWLELSRQKVFFVTRLKDNIEYGIVEPRAVRPDSGIVRDEVVLLARIQEEGPVALMRRIEVWVEDKQETIVLLTNHLKLAAATVAEVYRERWQIEQFFRALKQSLRIKTFVGTSANAVLVQIWTALIAMLLVRWLQMRSTFGWSLSNLVALLRQQLFVYRDLMTWLNHPFESPPELYAAEQLALEWA